MLETKRLLMAASLLAACAAPGGEGPADEASVGGKADAYATSEESCGGFARVSLDTPDWLCAGRVASSDDHRFKPRVLFELPGRPNEMLITDLHSGWAVGAGRIWYLDAREPDATILKPIYRGLTLPNQIVEGPEDHIFVSSDDRLVAFPTTAIGEDGELDETQMLSFLTDLPPFMLGDVKNSMHPVKHFVFDDEWNLYVNVGAYTDHCERWAGRECHEADRRIDGENGSPSPHDWGAVIRRYDYRGSIEAGWSDEYRVVAFGLRNSMGLTFTEGGDLVQVENGRDFREGGRPYEELNVIPREVIEGTQAPRHYGWPYCYDAYETSDEWADYEGFRCSPDNGAYEPPHILLPPHGAPLGLSYYRGSRLSEIDGQLIVPLHGYRTPGHRILAFEVDERGLPIPSEGASWLDDPTEGSASIVRDYPSSPHGVFAAQATHLVHGWFDVPDVRPKGAPMAPLVASDGSLWIADDKNKTILRFDRAEGGGVGPVERVDLYPYYEEVLDADEAARGAYESVVTVLRSEQCSGCHDDFRVAGTEVRYPELQYVLSMGTWIRPQSLEESVLWHKLSPPGASSMPPLGREFSTLGDAEEALGAVESLILALPTEASVLAARDAP